MRLELDKFWDDIYNLWEYVMVSEESVILKLLEGDKFSRFILYFKILDFK